MSRQRPSSHHSKNYNRQRTVPQRRRDVRRRQSAFMPIVAISLAAFFVAYVFIQIVSPPQTIVPVELAEKDSGDDIIKSSALARESSPPSRVNTTMATSQPERLSEPPKKTRTKKPKIAYHSDNIWAASVKEGSFEIRSSMPTLPVITCDYRIPLDINGKPMMTAHDLVLLFPYPSEKQAIKGIAKNLPSKWGFSTLSLRFPGFAAGTTVMGDDRERFYYYPESGAGQAWVDAIRKVREIEGLEERPVIVTGRSGGGSAAGLFADAYPELVCAVANEAGRVFSDELRFKGPTLIMYGAHDYVVPPVEAWLQRAQLESVDVLRYTFAPNWRSRGTRHNWHHPIHGAATDAFLRWIIDVADMRIQHGLIAHSSTWPIQDAGIAYSSEIGKRSIDKLVKSSLISEHAGLVKIIAEPAPSKDPLGIVVMVLANDAFSLNVEDVQLFAEQIADNGLHCIALLLDDASDVQVAQVAITDLALADSPYAKLPAILVTKDIQLMVGIVEADIHQWMGAIMIRPRRDLLQSVCESSAQRNMRIQVIATEQQMPWFKETVTGSLGVEWSTINKPKNREYWQRDCNNAVATIAKRWVKFQNRRE